MRFLITEYISPAPDPDLMKIMGYNSGVQSSATAKTGQLALISIFYGFEIIGEIRIYLLQEGYYSEIRIGHICKIPITMFFYRIAKDIVTDISSPVNPRYIGK